MKKHISVLIILAYSFVFFGQAFPNSSNSFMKVCYVKDKYNIAGDKGSEHGVTKDSIYRIRHNGINIGRAKVFNVASRRCALKIVEIKSDWVVEIGFHLRLDISDEALFFIQEKSNFTKDALIGNMAVSYTHLRAHET